MIRSHERDHHLSGAGGRLIHDFWKPYLAYDCLHGLCNTHHLRELLFLFEEQKQTWAGKMTEVLLDMHHFTLSRKEIPIIQLTEEEKTPWLSRHHRPGMAGKPLASIGARVSTKKAWAYRKDKGAKLVGSS